MQEEVNDKTIALSVKTTKLTGTVLKVALQKFLSEMEKQKQKGKAKAAQPKQGKQTMKQLMQKNTQITNIEVTDGNIKSFERVARKYGIDFSLKKDASENPPKYIVFFKARDVDVMTAAFKEYTANDHSSKAVLIADMKASLPYIDDSDMAMLMEETVKALESMTEEEYAEIFFEPAMDEDETWEVREVELL